MGEINSSRDSFWKVRYWQSASNGKKKRESDLFLKTLWWYFGLIFKKNNWWRNRERETMEIIFEENTTQLYSDLCNDTIKWRKSLCQLCLILKRENVGDNLFLWESCTKKCITESIHVKKLWRNWGTLKSTTKKRFKIFR